MLDDLTFIEDSGSSPRQGPATHLTRVDSDNHEEVLFVPSPAMEAREKPLFKSPKVIKSLLGKRVRTDQECQGIRQVEDELRQIFDLKSDAKHLCKTFSSHCSFKKEELIQRTQSSNSSSFEFSFKPKRRMAKAAEKQESCPVPPMSDCHPEMSINSNSRTNSSSNISQALQQPLKEDD